MKNEVKDFWENCDDTYAHLKANNYLKSEEVLFSNWDKWYINELEKYTNFKSVLDYGIGGGLLAQHLSDKYNLERYVGVDISERQLKNTEDRLKKLPLKYKVHNTFTTPYIFLNAKVDLFISQAVIQHFPDLNYLDSFLINVNESEIPVVALQIRYNKKTHFPISGDYNSIKNTAKRCHTNSDYISNILKNYELIWSGDIMKNKYQYLIFKIK